jgi:hypothetical protein
LRDPVIEIELRKFGLGYKSLFGSAGEGLPFLDDAGFCGVTGGLD